VNPGQRGKRAKHQGIKKTAIKLVESTKIGTIRLVKGQGVRNAIPNDARGNPFWEYGKKKLGGEKGAKKGAGDSGEKRCRGRDESRVGAENCYRALGDFESGWVKKFDYG